MQSLKDSDSDFEDRRKFENIQKLWREVRSINSQEPENIISHSRNTNRHIADDSYVGIRIHSHYQSASDTAQQCEQLREDNMVLLEELKTKNQKIIKFQTLYEEMIVEHNRILDQLEQVTQENRQLNYKLSEIENSLEDIYNDKVQKGVVMLEVSHLRDDLMRAMQLLSKTQEYGDLFEDVLPNEMNFLVGANQILQKISSSHRQRPITQIDTKKENIPEDLMWVPQKAVQVLNELDIAEQERNEILCSINIAFHEFWSSRLRKQKNNYLQELNSLKRQLQNRYTHDQVQAQKTISRLKKQIQETKHSKDIIFTDGRFGAQAAQIKECFKLITLKDSQNKELQQTVEHLAKQIEQNYFGSSQRREIFMEGALWMIERVFEEIKTNDKQRDSLNNELNVKMEDLLQNNEQKQTIIKIYKWFTDIIHETFLGLKERIQQIKLATKCKLENSNVQVIQNIQEI